MVMGKKSQPVYYAVLSPKSSPNTEDSHPEKSSSFIFLDGVHGFRVIANISVIAFHSLLYWAVMEGSTLEDTLQMINQNNVLKVIACANLGVDAFVVLSGFLAAFHKGEGYVSFSFTAYVLGRCKRVLLPYFLTLIAIYFIVPHSESIPIHMKVNHDVMFAYCPQTLSLSFFLLNNFIGFGGCGIHLWSVSLQMHLFVIYALVLRKMSPNRQKSMSRLTAIAGITFLLCAALRFVLAVICQIVLPIPAFEHQDMSMKSKGNAFRYYHSLYFFTPSRLCNFTAGILLAAFMQLRSTSTWTKHTMVVPAMITSFLTVLYLQLMTSIEYEQTHGYIWKFSPAWASLVFHGSPGASLLFASILYCFITFGQKYPRAIKIGKVSIVNYLSQASYWIYLIHPLVLYWVQYCINSLNLGMLVSWRAHMPMTCLAFIFCAAYLGSLSVYCATSQLVEILCTYMPRYNRSGRLTQDSK